MSAAWIVFRAGVRRRWRAWTALALLIGLFAAVVTALAAGARRTDSAYPRLLTWSRAPDLMFYTASRESSTFASPSVASIEQLPVAMPPPPSAPIPCLAPVTPRSTPRRPMRSLACSSGGKSCPGGCPTPAASMKPMSPSPSLSSTTFGSGTGSGSPCCHCGVGPGGAVPDRRHRRGAIEFPPQTGSGINLVWATPAFYRHEQGKPVSAGIAVAMRLRQRRRGPAGGPDRRHSGWRRGNSCWITPSPSRRSTPNGQFTCWQWRCGCSPG